MSSRHWPRVRVARALVALTLFVILSPPSVAQALSRITGTVVDASDGAPLVGANVGVSGTALATTTGADGRFEIARVPAGPLTLVVRFVGYPETSRRLVVAPGASLSASFSLTPGAELQEAVVEGRAAGLVGVASAASEGSVGQDQIAPRPLLRVGEVLETVPGLIVTQHSGSGKANQFFLRGFNLDHGTDFSASLEGVPFNLPTHAHGQGWLDLNQLVPELIERIEFDKGPYDASGGDFSTAGSARIRYVRRLERGIARVEGGTDEYARAFVANSSRLGRGDLLYAFNTTYYNGPWDNPENSALVSGIAKFSTGTAESGASLTALAYHNDWNSTDQVAQRAVDGGLITRLGALDPSDGGTTGRYTLAAQATRTRPGTSMARASAYAAYYHLNLFSNFTYFLDNPTLGDQFEQADKRLYTGANIAQTWFSSALGRGTANTAGVDLRHDQIFQVALFNTSERARFNTVRDDEVAETSLGAYVENETRWTPAFRTTVGVRGDAYRFDVNSDTDANSGTATDFIASPKLALAVGPWRNTEAYLNAGYGFHSNDARGTTIAVDPQSGDAVDRVDPLVRTRGAEVGARTTAVRGLQSTLALWTIRLGSELVFVGDAGGTEASDATRHTGVEFNNYYALADWLNLNLDVALTRSRYTGDDLPDGDRIENSVGRVVTGGIYAGRASGPVGALQLRSFGPRPLTGDGSVTSDATALVNAQVGYRFQRVAVALDVLNLFDSDAADVSYFYGSRLRGEAAEVEDIHAHPVIPRTARLSIVARF